MNKVLCPECGQALQRVRNESGWLNNDQFDSIKAGDWYCNTCKGDRGKSGHRYFWDREVMPPQISKEKKTFEVDASLVEWIYSKPYGTQFKITEATRSIQYITPRYIITVEAQEQENNPS